MFFFQKISHESDIIFDDSPLDASEGQRFLHARSANEIESDDEHWLWSQFSRVKRSIESVIGNGNQHHNKRTKRGFWPWESDDTETTTTEEPTTKSSFNWLDPFGLSTDESSTTQSPEYDNRHQNDGSTEDELEGNQEDLDIDPEEGSGSSRYDEAGDTESRFCKLHTFFCLFNKSLNFTCTIFSPPAIQAQ